MDIKVELKQGLTHDKKKKIIGREQVLCTEQKFSYVMILIIIMIIIILVTNIILAINLFNAIQIII